MPGQTRFTGHLLRVARERFSDTRSTDRILDTFDLPHPPQDQRQGIWPFPKWSHQCRLNALQTVWAGTVPVLALKIACRVNNLPRRPHAAGLFSSKKKQRCQLPKSRRAPKKSTLATSVTTSPHSLHPNVRSSGRPPNLGIVLVCLHRFAAVRATRRGLIISSCYTFGSARTAQH